MTSKYDKYNRMSLVQLEHEYVNCDSDPVKNQILKKLINNKLIEEQKRKNEEKKIQLEIADKVNNIIKIKERQKQREKQKEVERMVEKRGNMEQYWEYNQENKKLDPKFKNEVELDRTNNKLMERLNSELDFRINSEKIDDTIKPYSDNTFGNYNDFERHSIPPKNFSSKRLLH